ncbi:hypothetical protein GE09DRAFT_1157064 [Coniochaeta sp. 2T2.1]|nr:hypothetical protein GE09DRAFT_1157064 [Coniochaeta sp. 2T2.1]
MPNQQCGLGICGAMVMSFGSVSALTLKRERARRFNSGSLGDTYSRAPLKAVGGNACLLSALTQSGGTIRAIC